VFVDQFLVGGDEDFAAFRVKPWPDGAETIRYKYTIYDFFLVLCTGMITLILTVTHEHGESTEPLKRLIDFP
jgi:hypothetical protein